MREAAVVDAGGWVRLLTPAEIGARLLGGDAEVVLSLGDYERDLGMPLEAQVRRQLEVDLPRCVVRLDGARTRSADAVLGATAHPRLCTQAVVAPVLEWLLHAGWIAHELGDGAAAPLAVDVARHGATTRATKRLGLRTWAGASGGEATVRVEGDARRHTLVASVAVHLPRRSPRHAGAPARSPVAAGAAAGAAASACHATRSSR